MYLLTKKLVQEAVAEAHCNRLAVTPFDRDSMEPTWYYFHLGRRFCRYTVRADSRQTVFDQYGQLEAASNLTLKPNEYVLIESLEAFGMEGRTLGIFGGCSDLTKRGVQLVHSPFIDPSFARGSAGVLELGLHNLTSGTVAIPYGSRIGKIAFFDLADTYPIDPIVDSAVLGTFQERRRAE